MKSDSTSRSIPSAHNPRIKFKSTLWLLFMLVIVGVFHLIKSPCDGREGNLLTIVYKKMMGTYVQNIFETIPFSFEATNITVISTEEIHFIYKANHPSKVVCITDRSDVDAWNLSYVESELNRFYFHSNRVYDQKFPIHVEIGESSRLYCKVFDLGISEKPVMLFESDPFVIRYSVLELRKLSQDDRNARFEIIPKQFYVEQQNSTAVFESGEIELYCDLKSVTSEKHDDISAISMRGYLPLQFDISEDKDDNLLVQCHLFSIYRHVQITARPLTVVIAPLYSESHVISFLCFNKHI